MRSYKLVFGLALLSATTVLSSGFAQTPAAAPAAPAPAPVAGPPLVPPTVAVVDMQRVLRDSAAGRSIQSQLEVESRKFRDQVTQLQDQIKAGENDLRRQRSVMAQEAFNEQAQALQRKQADAQRTVQERQEALQKGEGDAANVVVDNMRDIVQQLAAERHLGLVVSKQVVISFSDKNMDITDDIIQRLNTKLPTVAVTIPAPGAAAAPAPAAASTAPVGPVKKK
jgi:Skp family chaperone for outer membrane proteins